jgi:tetratricopeptide (TPR) repeat protein
MRRFLLNSALLTVLLGGVGVGVCSSQPRLQQDGPLHPPPDSQNQKNGDKSSDNAGDQKQTDKQPSDKQDGQKQADDDSASSSSSSSGVQQELQGEDKGQKYDPMPAEKDVDVGTYYMHKGSYDAAIARFQDAIEQKADYAKPRLLLAQIYEKKGEKVSAVKYYKEYLQVYPQAPEAKKIHEKIARLSPR